MRLTSFRPAWLVRRRADSEHSNPAWSNRSRTESCGSEDVAPRDCSRAVLDGVDRRQHVPARTPPIRTSVACLKGNASAVALEEPFKYLTCHLVISSPVVGPRWVSAEISTV